MNLLIAVGMLAVVPLGLALIEDGGRLRPLWYAGALPGALALWLPRGALAVALAALYAAATAVLASRALPRAIAALSSREDAAREAAVATALAAPVVAGVALVAERGGYALFGYDPVILRLTVAHFHFAGFAAALVAGLVARADGGRLGTFAAWSVPAGTLAVLSGYFVSQWAEFAGAVVLTCGMWAVAAVSLRGGVWLRVSGAVLAGAMVPALWYALGEASGLPHPGLAWTAATHGVANALGFGLCGMIGWRMTKEPVL
ncbi:YndJ family protein [Actinocorallia longicatena]|uniref:YndJ family protein n=1 Tax=Actinocorallia longicatena TaxID=111803 RepID=UPI0031E07A5A